MAPREEPFVMEDMTHMHQLVYQMYNQYVEHLRAQKQVKHTLWGGEGMGTTST